VLLRRRPAHHFVTVADGGQLGPSDFGFRDLKHLKRLWEQFRLYHRKNEKVVKDGRRLNVGRYAIDAALRYASGGLDWGSRVAAAHKSYTQLFQTGCNILPPTIFSVIVRFPKYL